MKLLVETTGAFMLTDLASGQEVPSHRPAVVGHSNFFQHRVSLQQLRVLGELTDDATDAEFAKFLAESEGDTNLAVESFVSVFGPEKVTEKSEKRARKAKE
jgi:hypothetical protein